MPFGRGGAGHPALQSGAQQAKVFAVALGRVRVRRRAVVDGAHQRFTVVLVQAWPFQRRGQPAMAGSQRGQ
jgi:hypothetical protein